MSMVRTLIACVAGLLCITWPQCHQVLAGEAEKEEDVEMNADVRQKIHEACLETMLRIQSGLHALSNRFPRLEGVGAATVVKGSDGVADSGDKLGFALEYRKNVRVVIIHPDERGFVPSSDERLIVEEGGVLLDIHIVEGPIKMGVTGRCELPIRTSSGHLQLVYNLRENPEDIEMERAVKQVIESNVDALAKKLSQILDASDAASQSTSEPDE